MVAVMSYHALLTAMRTRQSSDTMLSMRGKEAALTTEVIPASGERHVLDIWQSIRCALAATLMG